MAVKVTKIDWLIHSERVSVIHRSTSQHFTYISIIPLCVDGIPATLLLICSIHGLFFFLFLSVSYAFFIPYRG